MRGWTRRRFLGAVGAMGSGWALAGFPSGLTPLFRYPRDAAPKQLKLLILGGTGFLGPATVEAAVSRGHTMTLFNRGKTDPEMFSHLEQLRGDRDGDLNALHDRQWDAVIDTSGYVPRIVTDSAKLLADAVEQYVFISTISVYKNFPSEDIDEESEVATIEDPTEEKVDGRTYGPLKALCEQAAEKQMPGRVTSIRPGLIVGPRDRTDRFTYWPVRVDRGGEVLAPGDPGHQVQYIDMRDLGLWIIRTIEEKHLGVYNAIGSPLPMADLLEACRLARISEFGEAKREEPTFTWVDTEFLEAQGVRPWSDMPVWIPPAQGRDRCTVVANARACRAGLQTTLAEETCRATLAWHRSRGEDYELRAGIKPEREQEVLAEWHRK